MRTKTLTQIAAMAAALLASSAQAQMWSRSEPKHSTPAKTQAPGLQLQEAAAEPTKPQATAAQTLRQPEPQIIKETRIYEQTLRDLAEKAEQIVQQMPDKPDQLARNFGELREVLMSARTNLTAILERKAQIDTQAQTVLQSAADLRQSFADLAKNIEDRLQQVRQKQTDNPRAVEAAASALEGIKAACQHGEIAIGPLRQLVLETHRQGQAIFAELEFYPQIFDYAIETCDLYKKGIGEPASYAAVVEGLTKARANLRSIIETFIQAAQKAEEAIKKIPPATDPPPPIS